MANKDKDIKNKKKVVKTDVQGSEFEDKKERVQNNEKRFSSSSLIMPYVLMLFSVILAICFITVQLLDMTDGAGVIGYAIQWLFCGFFGSAAFVLPAVLFYIGLRKCIFNFRWASGKRQATAEHNMAKDRRRITVLTVTGVLFVVFLSIMFGVINDYYSFDIIEMWSDAAEYPDELCGGLLGSSLGMLMVTCFQKVISIILLVMFMVVTLFFMSGLTPALLVEKIQEKREYERERRAREEEEALRLAVEAEAEEKKRKNRMVASQMTLPGDETDKGNKALTKNKKSMTADELLDDDGDEDDHEVEYHALDITKLTAGKEENKNAGTEIENKNKLIVPSDDGGDKEEDEEEKTDFGGDPAFDINEYSGLNSVLKDMKPSQTTQESKNKSGDEVLELLKESSDNVDDKKEEKNDTEETELINLEKMDDEEIAQDMAAVAPEEGEEETEVLTPYVFPPVDMLSANPNAAEEDYTQELNENAQRLLDTLSSFKVSIDAINYSRGPTITRYELKPAAGTRVRAIANLVDDIALSLATSGVRIEAPIPNKPAVGIEVPNRTRATVYLRDLIDSTKFFEAKSRLTASLGMDVGGNPVYFDITKMPHLLIAGATGMGKSVCINTIIVSLLYKAKPDELKLILIDPKKVEFTIYKHIPHLYAPIVSDPKKAAGALASAVAEMERRFELIEEAGVRDITGYNAAVNANGEGEFMPHMVIIIDELADLMMTAPDEVETSICRLAQKARAAGIHIIIGTQRPSVDVITGLIKANIPSRIACTVASPQDSRTILDMGGAEKLIGRGDMLFAPVGASKPMRVQGAFVSEGEVEKIVTYIRDNNAAGKFNAEFIQMINENAALCGAGKKGAQSGGGDFEADTESEGGDSKFNDAVKLAIEEGKVATSLLQRRLGVGYGRAAKIIDAMEERGYVSKPDGNKPRRVLITMEEYMRRKMNNELDDISDDEL